MTSEICNKLQWDSEFWGFTVAKVNCDRLRENIEVEILEWCITNKVKCLYFAADGSDPDTLSRAYRAGFQFVDVRIELEYDSHLMINNGRTDLTIRKVEPKDIEILINIAKTAYYDTRFFKDTNFNKNQVVLLYEEWIKRDFTKGKVLGLFPDNITSPRGYVSLTNDGPEISRIGLIAVEQSLRGKGFGRLLLEAAVANSLEMGARKIKVATQGTNIAALKLYENSGFRVNDVRIWFHRWFPPQMSAKN